MAWGHTNPAATVIATGRPCRHQIRDLTGRVALHRLEVLGTCELPGLALGLNSLDLRQRRVNHFQRRFNTRDKRRDFWLRFCCGWRSLLARRGGAFVPGGSATA